METPTVPTPVTLRYWPAQGRVQALVDFLTDRDVPFQDARLELDEGWATARGDARLAGPFASLPVLQWGSEVLSETLPIATFLHRTFCTPELADPASAVRHDMICSAAYLDVSRKLADLLWCQRDFPGTTIAARAPIVLPRVLDKVRRMDRSLHMGSPFIPLGAPFIGGETPTVGDFFLFEALEALVTLMGPAAGLLERTVPIISAHHLRIRNRPSMQRMFERSRPSRLTLSPDEPDALKTLEAVPWEQMLAEAP